MKERNNFKKRLMKEGVDIRWLASKTGISTNRLYILARSPEGILSLKTARNIAPYLNCSPLTIMGKLEDRYVHKVVLKNQKEKIIEEHKKQPPTEIDLNAILKTDKEIKNLTEEE